MASVANTFVTGQPAPLHIAGAEGCYLITKQGERILDGGGGAIVVNVGHGRREIAEAMAACVRDVGYVVPPFATDARLRLVERLTTRWLPEGIDRVTFGSGGSEAMDSAIRLARQHHVAAGRPNRTKVMGRDLSYHGTTLATLGLGAHHSRRAGMEPWFPNDQPRPAAHYCLRCPFGKQFPECDLACAQDVERAILEAGPETVAALVVEPIVGSNAGALVPPGDYLERVQAICKRHGVLLIADEVMTGCGRTGTNFAVDHWNIAPDILVCGKGLTSGYAPLAAICAKASVVDPLAAAGQDFMFFTYSAHSVCCAAGDKALEILEEEDLVERAAEMGKLLHERLGVLEEHPHVAQVRGRGMLAAVELVEDKATLAPYAKEHGFVYKVMAAGLDQGVFFYPGGNDPARDVICLGPPSSSPRARSTAWSPHSRQRSTARLHE